MTYLDKLLELNKSTLKKANLLFAAKHRLEDEEENQSGKSSRIMQIKEEIKKRFLEYEEALRCSQNMISFVNLNNIRLKSNYCAFLNG